MKNIAIIYDRELSIGGVESHLLMLFKEIDRGSYQFTLVSPIAERIRALATELGVNVRPVPPIHPIDPAAVRQLKVIFQQEHIDLVHIHSAAAAVSARLAARWCKLPIIVTVHLPATNYYGHRTNYKATLGRFLYIQIDRILNFTCTDQLIYVSRQVREKNIQDRLAPRQHSQVIPNGVDLEKFHPRPYQRALRELFNTPTNAQVITFVGRLDETKGVDTLLDAISLIKQSKQGMAAPLRIWLIGAGPQEAELREKTHSLGLAQEVLYMGFQEDIPEYLHSSDIFVLPSRNEAMSISILEALAAGLPCVVTDVGENSDLVENGRQGLVVPPNSPRELANALLFLLDNPSRRASMHEQALVKADNYSSQKMVSGIQKVYAELLDKQSKLEV